MTKFPYSLILGSGYLLLGTLVTLATLSWGCDRLAKQGNEEPKSSGKIVLDHAQTGNVYHIGGEQLNYEAFLPIDQEGLISIRAGKDQNQLYIQYNLPQPNQITLRFYDGKGMLRYIEKLENIGLGMERELELTNFRDGDYVLQLSMEGRIMSQKIALHSRGMGK